MTLEFIVPGKPAPQGSKRFIGNGRMIESSRDVGPWRERVALAAHNAMLKTGAPMFTTAVMVELNFVLPRPAATPKRYTPYAIKRPDLDKLARACLDAITNTAIADDALVVSLNATKRLAHPGESSGVQIRVEQPREPQWIAP